MTDIATVNVTLAGPPTVTTIALAGPQGTPGAFQEILGTTDQISVALSGSGDSIATLSLPQNIHTGATPTFAGITIDGTASATTFSGSGADLTSIPNAALVNDAVTVTAGTGLLGGGSVALGSSITLSLPQAIATSSSPTFASLALVSSTNPQVTFTNSANSQEYSFGYNLTDTGMGLYNSTHSKWLIQTSDSTYTVNFPQNIASTSTTTGTVTIEGGLGVTGTINAGAVDTVGLTSTAQVNINASGASLIQTTSGDVTASGVVYHRFNDVNGNAAYIGFGGSATPVFTIQNYKNGNIDILTNDVQVAQFPAAGGFVIATPASGTGLTVNGGGASITGTISTTGNVTHNAPSSGTTLAITQQGTGTAFSIGATGNATNGSASISFDASGNQYIQGLTASTSLSLGSFQSGTSLALVTSGTNRIAINSAGNVTVNAPSSGTTLGVTSSTSGTGISLTGAGSGTSLLTMADTTNTNGVNVLLTGNGATTPNKYIRVQAGVLEIVNSAYSTQIFDLTDAGALSVPSTITGSEFIGAGTGLTGTAASLSIGGTANEAGNLNGGAAGSIPYQTGAGATSYIAAGTNGYQLTMVSGAPAWAPSSATSATNIAGGAAGDIVYQTGSGATSFIAPGTNTYVLTMVSGSPAWAAAAIGTSITGTANQIVASASTGPVTLSFPSQVLANIQDNLQAEGSLGSGTTTIDWSQGNVVEITLTGSALTLAFTNTPSTANSTQVMNILLYQDSTGSRTLPTFSSTIRWDSGITPVLTTTANKADILQILAVNVGGTTTYFGSQIMGNA